MSDLSTITGVLNVRSLVPVWPLLTVHFQTELGVNTRVNGLGARRDVTGTHRADLSIRSDAADTQPIVSDVQNDVVNTKAIISNVQNGVVNTRAPVSNTYLNRQKGTPSNRHSVNVTIYRLATECSPFPSLLAGQRPPVARSPRSWQQFKRPIL